MLVQMERWGADKDWWRKGSLIPLFIISSSYLPLSGADTHFQLSEDDWPRSLRLPTLMIVQAPDPGTNNLTADAIGCTAG